MAEGCRGCRDGEAFPRAFSMAFQPIADLERGSVFAYEALVRGPSGEGAPTILEAIDESNRYAFDQQCRVKAIELATRLRLADGPARLSINFMPNAVYEPAACIRLTLATARRHGFPLDRIIFEFTENEALDVTHVVKVLRAYRALGFMTAIDDFGAGHSGLGLLTRFQPDIVKLDMALIRGIDADTVKRSVVAHTVRMLRELNILPICEGVETAQELEVLRAMGVRHAQGYLLARPAFEALPALRERQGHDDAR